MIELAQKNAKIWERDEHDHYVEPQHVGVSLFRELALPIGTIVVDPCCGWARLLRAAEGAGLIPLGSDIVPRWEESPDGAFAGLGVGSSPPQLRVADWFDLNWGNAFPSYWRRPEVIASNPPYDRADEFLELALQRAGSIVALILPATWHCGDARSRRLEKTPLFKIMPITPRPSMPPGRAILSGQKVGGGTKDFAVFIWLKGYRGNWQGGWLRRAAE